MNMIASGISGGRRITPDHVVTSSPRKAFRKLPLACLDQHLSQMPNALGVIGHRQAVLSLLQLKFNLPDISDTRLNDLPRGLFCWVMGFHFNLRV